MQTNSPISIAEMERRWAAARAVLEDNGVDALVMQAREDWMGGYVRWFTDIPANNGYPRTVVFFHDRPMTVIEMGAFGMDRRVSTDDGVHRGVERILGTPSFHSVGYTVEYDARLLVQVLSEAGCRRIGLLTPGALPHSLVQALGALDNGFDVVDLTDPIDVMKAVKSAEEIELIRKTALIQDQVFSEVCDFIRPGITDREVAAHAESKGRRLGSDQGIFLGISAPLGKPSRFLNRPFQTRTLQAGDHLSLLIEINGPGGLYLEIARTIVLGEPNVRLLQAFENVRLAQQHTLSLMRAGAAPAEIAAAHDDWMMARNLPPEARLYAHGQGCEMVERPLIRRDETMKLAENMCLAVHPGYDDGEVFAVICDNYLIQRDGVGPCLHKTEKKIFSI
ncbi:M24 family metallopeptidase [Chelativorans alearense]|uniref:M24 family metallopeptidase n=1 Tax=Chelativorans alearense TaxID=2681495 RepID=UPI0013D4DBD9|nr:M24 family metallopeptidase [Chelativorans alearense]